MKTAAKKTAAKTVQNKSNKAKAKKLTKAQKQAKFQKSDYFKQVIAPNRALKKELKTLKGAIKVATVFLSESPEYKPLAEKLASITYPKLKKVVRKSKAGNYCPFFVLQALRKL